MRLIFASEHVKSHVCFCLLIIQLQKGGFDEKQKHGWPVGKPSLKRVKEWFITNTNLVQGILSEALQINNLLVLFSGQNKNTNSNLYST